MGLEEHPSGKCLYCNKGLKAFTVTNDWGTRKLHKKCWWEIQGEIDLYQQCLVECDSDDLALKCKQKIRDIKKKWTV